MAGIDTIRGIGFQHAYAIQLALDVLDDPASLTLTIEGAADVVDVEIARQVPPTRPVHQAKSRQEPYDWPPGELGAIIVAWQDAGGGQDAPLSFVSDGPASPETATKLKPALERARHGALSEEERSYLDEYGIDPDRAAYVDLATRSESTGALLAMAENRVRRLQLISGTTDTEDAAERAVDRLFRIFGVQGGEQRIERRTFERDELAGILGVNLDVIDSGAGWSSEVADVYRAEVAQLQPQHPWVELGALVDSATTVPALALQVRPDRETDGPTVLQSAPMLVEAGTGAGLCGAAGTGKTTTTRQMAAAAADAGRVAVAVTATAYRRGDLDRRLRRVLEATVGRPLVASAVAGALGEPGATLIVDGMSGLGIEQEDALAADLREARDRFPALQLIVADRERAFARRFDLPTYTLSPLSTEERQTIAGGVLDNSTRVVADLEQSLGDAVENPLLFVMALALTRVGVSATSRAEIFAGFLDGLRERAKETTVDAGDLAALRLAAVALTRERRFAADRYWWLAATDEALTLLRERGIYDIGDRSAEGVFRRLQGVGFLFEDDVAASVSLLHDSFRDYLVSVALLREEAQLTSPDNPEWETAVELLAEQGGLTSDIARLLARENVVAATRAARFDNTDLDVGLVGELTRLLVASHLGASPIGKAFAVCLVRGATHAYACIVAAGEDRELSTADAQKPLAAVALATERGSLAFASALFRVVLNQLTSSEPPALLRPIPDGQPELTAAIETQFRDRQAALREAAERLFPTLADRLIAGVGWTGLRAEVGPAETLELLPGQLRTFHSLDYSLSGEDVAVTVADTETDSSESSDYSGRTTAESLLESAPEKDAMEALVKQLAELVPEAD